MNVLSLFDGISCGYEALKRANIKVDKYFASEIDKYAIQVSMKNHPDIIQIGDVTKLDLSNLPKIDLLIGGSPCQGFSNAGKRLNFDDPRSKLFFRYVEILKQVKPKYFLLENVRMKKEWCDIITEHVGVEPILINSSLVSAQNRKRLYWTNIEGITQPEDKGIMLRDVLEPKVNEKYYVKPKSNTVRSSGRGSGINDRHNWDTIRLYDIGKVGQGQRVYSTEGKSTSLTAFGGGQGAKTGLYLIGSTQKHHGVCSVDTGKSTTLTSSMGTGGGHIPMLSSTQNIDSVIRKLTPLECERLQTLDDGYTDAGISNTQRYKCIGNAWTVDVVAHIFSFMDREQKMKYRKKPIEVEAFQLNDRGLVGEVWFWDAVSNNDIITYDFGKYHLEPAWCTIQTIEGVMTARSGDYIVQGINGEIYPVKEEIFLKTYELIENTL